MKGSPKTNGPNEAHNKECSEMMLTLDTTEEYGAKIGAATIRRSP
jgi:hypothetical protein